MNNVIFILVDSVFSECLGNSRTEISSTPFIDELIKSGFYANSVYSYGPYTDAATRGLYCGNKSLDDYGYFFGLNSPNENHFKTFKENGYETIGLYYPYYLIGSKIQKNIDHSVFIGGFVYKSEWGGKFNYYAEKQKKSPLSDIEYSLLIKHVDLMFNCWLNFYDILDNDSQSGSIVNSLADKNKKNICRDKIKHEYSLYTSNKSKYIDGILELGLNHPLSDIDPYNYDGAIDCEFLKKKIYKKHSKFFSKLSRVEFWKNLINNKVSFKKALHNKRYFANWILTLFASKYSKYLSTRPNWQYSASMYQQVNASIDAIKNRKNKDKPFYLSLHTEEPHNYIAFFSYDCKNEQIIDEEIEYLKPLLNGCGKKFAGSLTYQLSLRYVDLNIKRLFKKLEEIGELDKTTVVITADHGSSYTFYPVREKVVNTFYKECYRTPLIIWKNNISSIYKGLYDGLYSAEDSLPTILSLENLTIPEQYKGLIIPLNKNGRDYIITEYMGPGVPDMLNREVWISARNENYMIAFKQPISEALDLNNCVEVYDLKNDKLELKNLRAIIDFNNEEIKYMIRKIEERFNEIRKKSKDFVNNLSSFSAVN